MFQFFFVLARVRWSRDSFVFLATCVPDHAAKCALYDLLLPRDFPLIYIIADWLLLFRFIFCPLHTFILAAQPPIYLHIFFTKFMSIYFLLIARFNVITCPLFIVVLPAFFDFYIRLFPIG